jgi:hypothetical protein
VRPPGRRDEIAIPIGPLRRLFGIIVIVALVVILAAVLIAQRDRIRLAFGGTEAAYVDGTTYQSVVLLTNQVYFGKLRIDGDVYTLTDVYSFSGASDASTGTVQLVKRGSELHGPQDPLVIPGRSVLFFENMRPDSQVMQAIAKIRSGQTSTPPPAATASPARTASPAPSASR